MAYFSNGSEGDVLEHQCNSCKLGELGCPIYQAQTFYNYSQLNDTTGVARQILEDLVNEKGECSMYAFVNGRKASANGVPSEETWKEDLWPLLKEKFSYQQLQDILSKEE